MLVSEYVLQIIEKRPYKYSTKLTNVADVKRLGIWDMDTSEIHSGMIHERVDKVANQNSRKRLYITARSMFKDYVIFLNSGSTLSFSHESYSFPVVAKKAFSQSLIWLVFFKISKKPFAPKSS